QDPPRASAVSIEIDEAATPLRKAVKCFCEIIGCRNAQIVAGELDVPLERVSVMMGDTAWTVNQGGASGSTGVEKGGIPLRTAAAEGVSRGITFSVSETVPQGSVCRQRMPGRIRGGPFSGSESGPEPNGRGGIYVVPSIAFRKTACRARVKVT